MDKCPYCESTNYRKVAPIKGEKFGLIELDTNTKSVVSDCLLPVDVYGCLECKSLHFESELKPI